MTTLVLNRYARRREKVFGDGKPRPMSRNVKLRIMALARVLMRPTESGKHYGEITAKHFAVLAGVAVGLPQRRVRALLSVAMRRSPRRPAVRARPSREAIKALEKAGLLTWVQRIKRVHERVINLFGEGVHGQRSRIFRTSNGYQFIEPPDVQSSKSENKSGTAGQESFPSLATLVPALKPVDSGLEAALLRLGSAIRTGASRA